MLKPSWLRGPERVLLNLIGATTNWPLVVVGVGGGLGVPLLRVVSDGSGADVGIGIKIGVDLSSSDAEPGVCFGPFAGACKVQRRWPLMHLRQFANSGRFFKRHVLHNCLTSMHASHLLLGGYKFLLLLIAIPSLML